MTVKLEWGLQPPDGYEGVAWGARAIYSLRITGRSVIDLVWDRQCAVGDKAEVQRLCNVLDMGALDLLREICTKERVRQDEHRVVRVEVGDVIVEANPRESCGYLYIVAYRRLCLACKRGVPESRVYFGATGPFCNTGCRESYLSRPTASDEELLKSYIPPIGARHPVATGLGYDGDEVTARARSVSRSTPFEPSTISNVEPAPFRCNVPMCGESGVCAECRRRGAK